MRAEFINPFIAAVDNTFKTMLACEIRRGAIALKDSNTPEHCISGIIGLSGKAIGTVVLSLSEAVALKASSVMLLTEIDTITEDVTDAVGELTNMVAGAAKAELENYKMQVTLPTVITGRNHDVRFPSDVTPICVSFDTDWGPMTLEVGLAPVRESVEA